MKRLTTLLLFSLLCFLAKAQISRLGQDVRYDISLQATAAGGNGDFAPFWFSNNRYGLGSIEKNSGLLRAGIGRDVETDSLRRWRIGYGLDLAGAVNHNSAFVLQQLYADFQYRALRLSVGQKERGMELKDENLSSGAMTMGINARPIPQLRLELPDFWAIPGTRGWLSLKGHIAYGMYTDNRWQRHFAAPTAHRYSANSFFHSKAGFLRVGNKDKFPVTLTMGLEMACQFAGEAWNLKDREDHAGADTFDPHQRLSHGISAFWHAFIPGGSDVTDGDFLNVEGNHVGSWHLRLDYHGKDWGVAAYAEHFFEDHSQMRWRYITAKYPWKDMLYGIEAHLPQNPVLTAIVYEHLRTNYQSGPIYHDKTPEMPQQVSANDNYYNHFVYGAWQHAGFSMGQSLLVSPLYNTNGNIVFNDNRIKAHHIGISGQPTPEIGYRVLWSHEKSWGTYATPRTDPVKGDFLLIEGTYRPRQVQGLSITASYGQNQGELLGKSAGAMLTVGYSGWIKDKGLRIRD